MNGKDVEREQPATDISTVPTSSQPAERQANLNRIQEEKEDNDARLGNKKKKSAIGGMTKFLYDPRRKTVLGRSALNWGNGRYSILQ